MFAVHAASLATTTPPSASCEPHAPPVLDQRDTSSCTGHGTVTGIATAFAAAGRPLPFLPSTAEVYRNGRAIDRVRHHDGSFDPLVDEGAMPNQVLRALNEYGIKATAAPDGKSSDVDSATINDEPKLGDLEAEALTVPIGEYAIRCVEQGAPLASVVEDMRKALAAGLPVGLGLLVDKAFEAWTPSKGPFGRPNQADIQGGHWMCAIGYRTASIDGGTVFVIRNSWGESWGLNGNIEVTAAFIAECSDLTAYAARKAS